MNVTKLTLNPRLCKWDYHNYKGNRVKSVKYRWMLIGRVPDDTVHNGVDVTMAEWCQTKQPTKKEMTRALDAFTRGMQAGSKFQEQRERAAKGMYDITTSVSSKVQDFTNKEGPLSRAYKRNLNRRSR